MRNAAKSLLNKLSSVRSTNGCAVSFYFYPRRPQNKAHSEDRILLKDLFRNAKKQAEAEGKQAAVNDLNKLEDFSDRLAQTASTPVAVFACAEHNIWEQVELPGSSGDSRVVVNGRFHLRPLAELRDRQILVALADRVKVRFVRQNSRGLEQFDSIDSELPRKARTDGFGGYDAGHKERHVGHWEMYHFKEMADRLKQLCESDSFDGVAIVCRAEIRPEIEPHLHSYVSDKLLGFIDNDPAMLSEEELRDEVSRLVQERESGEQQALVREVVGEAQRNARGSLGLKNVLESIERGEVQTLIIGDGFSATISECVNCGHLDTRTASACSLCNQQTREIDDVVDALTTNAMRSSLEIIFVNDPDFRRAGNIGALLRFRADQNTPAKLAS